MYVPSRRPALHYPTYPSPLVDTPDAEIVYAMSLVFTPPTPTNRYDARMNRHVETLYGPTHGFLDDELFVTLGLRDNEMGSVKMWAGELVAGMTGC